MLIAYDVLRMKEKYRENLQCNHSQIFITQWCPLIFFYFYFHFLSVVHLVKFLRMLRNFFAVNPWHIIQLTGNSTLYKLINGVVTPLSTLIILYMFYILMVSIKIVTCLWTVWWNFFKNYLVIRACFFAALNTCFT